MKKKQLSRQADNKNTNKRSWPIIIAVIALIILLTHTFNIHAFTIYSGSMEPKIKTGSIILTYESERMELKEGDIITFVNQANDVVTHRIKTIEDDDGSVSYVTKGDANEDVDSLKVKRSNIVGKPFFYVPYVGYFNIFVHQANHGLYNN